MDCWPQFNGGVLIRVWCAQNKYYKITQILKCTGQEELCPILEEEKELVYDVSDFNQP